MSSDPSYQQALDEVKIYDTTQGLTKIQTNITGGEGNRILIQQNNVLIQLVVNLHQRIGFLEKEIASLKVYKDKQPQVTAESQSDLSNLIDRLGNLNLGPVTEKTPKKKGTFYAFKDPYKILEEEKAKLKKPSKET